MKSYEHRSTDGDVQRNEGHDVGGESSPLEPLASASQRDSSVCRLPAKEQRTETDPHVSPNVVACAVSPSARAGSEPADARSLAASENGVQSSPVPEEKLCACGHAPHVGGMCRWTHTEVGVASSLHSWCACPISSSPSPTASAWQPRFFRSAKGFEDDTLFVRIDPDGRGFLVLNDGRVRRYVTLIESPEFEGDTFKEVSRQVEAWAQEQTDRAVAALRREFNPPSTGEPTPHA
jgi:hypothetical protein